MGFVALECPRCGAPIPPGARGTVVCAYCRATLVEARDGFQLEEAFEDEPTEAPGAPRFWLHGARYRVEGRIARGDSADVLLARRDHRVGERVVAKALRASGDRDRLEAEWRTLVALSKSEARGSHHFTRLLPQPVARGEARFGSMGHAGDAFATLYRFDSGFVHDFHAVRAAYPGGVPAAAAVWMYKRILELLVFVHESGFAHGAVLPRHLLVHARDHGVRLCGFTCAGALGSALAARVAADDRFYPSRATELSAALDVVMAARAVLFVLGGDPMRAPAAAPPELRAVLESDADSAGPGTAMQALANVDRAARSAFGAPRYVPFDLPGWS